MRVRIAAHDAAHLMAVLEEQFREIGPVLSCRSGDERAAQCNPRTYAHASLRPSERSASTITA